MRGFSGTRVSDRVILEIRLLSGLGLEIIIFGVFVKREDDDECLWSGCIYFEDFRVLCIYVLPPLNVYIYIYFEYLYFGIFDKMKNIIEILKEKKLSSKINVLAVFMHES